MKKVYALLLMAMFVVSLVPAVYGQDTDSIRYDEDKIKDEDAEKDYQDPTVRAIRRVVRKSEAADRLNMDIKAREETKERIREEVKEHIKERIPGVKDSVKKRVITRAYELRGKAAFKKFKGKAFKAREIAKERVAKARKRAAAARDKAKNARKRFHERREKIKERKAELKECKGDDSEECDTKRAEGKADAIEALKNAAETALEELEKVKANIEGSEDLSEEEAARLLEGIENNIANIEEAKAQVDALGEDSSKEDVKMAAISLRNALKKIKVNAKKAAGRLVHARVGRVIVKARQLEDRLNKLLERAEDAGHDVGSVDSLVDTFHSHLESAQTAYKNAKSQWDADKVREAQASMKDAMKSLKDAHATLKDVFKELKEQRLTDDLADVVKEEEDADAEPVYLDEAAEETAAEATA